MEDGVKEPFQGQKLKRSREMECGEKNVKIRSLFQAVQYPT